jgi:tetratricopeptide (TPR) repeat protein
MTMRVRMSTNAATGPRSQRLLACGCVLLATCCAAGTNATSANTAAALRAADAERAGRLREAVAAYTALLEQDAMFEPVVAPRLVELHVRLGEPAQALSWAARVARRHPEPAAYLAGIHARLGQIKDAELALRQALRDAPDAACRLPLLWQLAEIQERGGDPDAARETLRQARQAAPDDHRRKATRQRLDALALRHAQNPKPAAPAPKNQEEIP